MKEYLVQISKTTFVNPNNVNYIRPSGDARKYIVTFNFGNLTIDELEYRELIRALTEPMEVAPVVTPRQGSLFSDLPTGPTDRLGYGTAKFG